MGRLNIRLQKGQWLLLILLVFLLIVPFLLSSFWLRIVTGLLMWIGLALSWNMIGGYMGYVSFGHGAFFGLGAYLTAMLMGKLDFPFFPAMLTAGLLTYVFAWLVGYPTLRLSGTYFAIGTWCFAEMMRQLVLVLDITGGPEGLRLKPYLNETFFYFVMLALALFVAIFSYVTFDRSHYGLKVKAVREEETAASTLGLNIVQIKTQVFAVSAFFPGLIGGAYAYWITYIHPDSVLGPLISDQMVIMVLLGGIATLVGPIIGAVILYIGNRILWVLWGDSPAYLVILGIAIMIVILFLPQGLVSLWRGRKKTVPGKPAASALQNAAETKQV